MTTDGNRTLDGRLLTTLLCWSGLLLFFALLFRIVAPFLVSLGWALIIGIATYPLYRRLRNRRQGRDTRASLLMVLGVVLTIIVPVSGILYLLARELPAAYAVFERLATGGLRQTLDTIMNHPLVAPLMTHLQPYLGPLDLAVTDNLLPLAREGISFLLGYSTWFFKNSVAFFFKIAVMVIILLFVYRDGERILSRLRQVIPLAPPEWELLSSTVRRVVSAVLFGVFFTCLVQGTLGGLGFWFTGLPSPVFFGLLMAGCAIIPVVGTGLIWVPGAVALFVQGEVMNGIILIIWGAAVVGSIDNVIRPLFISGRGKIPLLVTAVGGLGGLFSFGLIGLVTGPILLSLSQDLLAIAARRREEQPPSAT